MVSFRPVTGAKRLPTMPVASSSPEAVPHRPYSPCHEVYDELKARGHDVGRLRTFGMSGCATGVMIDPATGNRFAAADPRRDCYAIAY